MQSAGSILPSCSERVLKYEFPTTLPSFELLPDFEKPRGIWSLPAQLDRVESGFIYTLSDQKSFKIALFAEEFFRGDLSRCGVGQGQPQFCTVLDLVLPFTAWRHLETDSIVFTRTSPFDLTTPDENFFWVGWVPIDGSPPQLTNKISLRSPVSPASTLHFQQTDGFIDVYCKGATASSTWATQHRGKSFELSLTGWKNTGFFQSPDHCDTCAGIHRNGRCPFLFPSQTRKHRELDTLVPNIPVASKRQRLSPHNPFRDGPRETLRRCELAEKIIERVIDEKIFLIEAPPCSGKSVLMEDIADAVSRRRCHHAIDFFRNLFYDLDLNAALDYQPERHYSPDLPESLKIHLGRINDLKQLISFAETELPDTFEFWLFLDEAQMRYHDDDLWGTLMRLPPRFYTVAAGSYGSHTGSASHSPPKEHFTQNKRMNLFPSPSESSSEPLCVAFTPDDFSNFVAQLEDLRRFSFDKDVLDLIKTHSSNPNWNTWYHPGVASTLTLSITNHMKKNGPHLGGVDQFNKCLAVTLEKACIRKPCSREGLGRTTPRLPVHGGGMPGPLSVVLSDVDRKGFIKVMGADTKKFGSVIVVNANNIWDRREQSLHLNLSKVSELVEAKPQYHSGNPSPFTDALSYKTSVNPDEVMDFKSVAHFLKPNLIATNACQRLLEVVPGHLTPETTPVDPDSTRNSYLKPFSKRDMYDHTVLSDYQQAAHDARRMGWLLQDPGAAITSDIVLRLPTRWHSMYLTSFLRPNDIDEKYLKISLDDYLKNVITNFRPSVLFQHLIEGHPPRLRKTGPMKLREAIYDCEFNFSSNALAGPLFLHPQVRTEDGKGTVDFVCHKRQWVIELMRDRSDIKGHIARFQVSGAYHKEWPEYDWRVVDFCLYDESPAEPEKEENYRLVKLVPKLDHNSLAGTIVAMNKLNEVFTCVG